MPTESQSLLRFVQLRRLTEGDGDPNGTCTTGPTVVGRCFDFRDDWSAEVQEAVVAGNRDRGAALYRERRDGPGEAGSLAAALALALLRLATVNQRLTVGDLRERLRHHLDASDLDPGHLRRGLELATTWAVDVVTLRRWLRPRPGLGASEPGRILRGIVLIRLAQSDAEDACRVARLTSGHVLHLPPLPGPDTSAHPAEIKADQLATVNRDLSRLRSRTQALMRQRDPTLADLQSADFPDLAAAREQLQRTAERLGLPPSTKASGLHRILDVEYAEARRTLEASRSVTGVEIDQNPIDPTTGGVWDQIPPVVPVLSASARLLGRGDLMIIRTSHLRYEAAEISHIENVLASEMRERSHVIDTSTSETVTETLKTLEETTQELETTEQSSLERATQQAASTSTSTSLGVSMSGGYGPVQAGIDIDASSSTSTSTSTSSAVSYAESLTEKASETLRSEATYRRTTTSTTRVTETNLHRFDNADGTGNIAGIYRWVNKVDLAQLYNYGERLLLEFVVPQPAAQYVYTTQTATAPAEPEPPLGWFLEIEELNEGNYVDKAARWDVVGLEPPPAEEIFAAATFVDPPARQFDYEKNSTDKSQPEWGYASYAKEVDIPDGYAASLAYVTTTWGLEPGEIDLDKVEQQTQAVQIAIAEDRLLMSDGGDGEASVSIDPELAGPVPVGISTDQRGGLTVSVRIRCERTDEAYEAWRLRTYEAIRSGYLAQLSAYESEMRLLATRQAYVSTTSPDANRLIEMQELKRGCQTILTGQDFDAYGAVTFPADGIPRIDRYQISREADHIQFFEDLFEWHNLVYLFYPYQWAGREHWEDLQARTSADPLHQSFLQAGAARVVVPVREGYEHAVGEYLATSEVPVVEPMSWRDGSNPYPPIEELIADALDRPDENEIAVGDPWEVTTPTSLVYLQAGPELNPEPE